MVVQGWHYAMGSYSGINHMVEGRVILLGSLVGSWANCGLWINGDSSLASTNLETTAIPNFLDWCACSYCIDSTTSLPISSHVH